jgi:hypothetical protein
MYWHYSDETLVPVDHDWFSLADPVAAVLGLQVLLRVPVTVTVKDHEGQR